MTSLSNISLSGGESYFDPLEDNKKAKLEKGKYNAHITKIDVTEEKIIQNVYCANIYNITVTIDKDNEKFGGREVRSNGVFHFLAPKDGDTFESQPSGNNKYYNLLKACGVECPTQEIDVNGEKRDVHMLPNMVSSLNQLEGKAIVATIGETKAFTNSEGNTITPMKVVWFETWEGGVDRDLVDEDLPF